MTRTYGGIIWTDHALQRLKQRRIRQEEAWLAFHNSDQSRFAQSRDAWVYYKTFQEKTIEVVAKQNEKKEWVVLSVWSKPASKKFFRQNALPIRLLIVGILILLLLIMLAMYRLL